MSSIDCYKILNVSNTCTKNEIKQSYRKLALQFHPDKNKAIDATEKFKKISQAYQIFLKFIKIIILAIIH